MAAKVSGGAPVTEHFQNISHPCDESYRLQANDRTVKYRLPLSLFYIGTASHRRAFTARSRLRRGSFIFIGRKCFAERI